MDRACGWLGNSRVFLPCSGRKPTVREEAGWANGFGDLCEDCHIKERGPGFPLMSSATHPPRDLDDDREWGDAQWDNHLGRIWAQPGPPQGGRVGVLPGLSSGG